MTKEEILQTMHELATTRLPEDEAPLPPGFSWEKISGHWTLYHMPSGSSVYWNGHMRRFVNERRQSESTNQPKGTTTQ